MHYWDSRSIADPRGSPQSLAQLARRPPSHTATLAVRYESRCIYKIEIKYIYREPPAQQATSRAPLVAQPSAVATLPRMPPSPVLYLEEGQSFVPHLHSASHNGGPAHPADSQNHRKKTAEKKKKIGLEGTSRRHRGLPPPRGENYYT